MRAACGASTRPVRSMEGAAVKMGQAVTIYVSDSGQVADVRRADWSPAGFSAERPSDFYDRETCSRLLAERLQIARPHDWIFQVAAPERIILVACYAIHRQQKDGANAKAVALHALRGGYPIGDYRADVLPSLLTVRQRPVEQVGRQVREERRQADQAEAAAQAAVNQNLAALIAKLRGCAQ